MTVSTGAPTTPTRAGWHLVSFENGDEAVIRWNGHAWVWGSITAPESPIVGVQWLGDTVDQFAAGSPSAIARWVSTISQLPPEMIATLTAEIDHGVLLQGQPVLLNGSGHLTGGTPTTTTSEAVPVNIIPSPIPPSAGNSHLSIPSLSSLFGSLSLWKGIGLILAGAAILVFAALELRKVG